MPERRDFPAAAPNQKWAGDISYIRTGEGWLYLAVILDLYSRRVIGPLSVIFINHCRAAGQGMRSMPKRRAIRTLDMAVAFRQPPKGCIHLFIRLDEQFPQLEYL